MNIVLLLISVSVSLEKSFNSAVLLMFKRLVTIRTHVYSV